MSRGAHALVTLWPGPFLCGSCSFWLILFFFWSFCRQPLQERLEDLVPYEEAGYDDKNDETFGAGIDDPSERVGVTRVGVRLRGALKRAFMYVICMCVWLCVCVCACVWLCVCV